MSEEVVFEKEWKEVLLPFFETKSFEVLSSFVKQEHLTKKVFPPTQDIFSAFSLTPFSQVKVVILGQDPYHDDNQAHGLCFSVPTGTKVPPSLKNIYKEIESDIGIQKDECNGNLESWAKQGVFLLNTILTVVAHTPASHKGKGWEVFTDMVIKTISDKHEHVVFMLWGNYAQSKKVLIDTKKHLVLESAHPSPFSMHKGFSGCKHFSQCNAYLRMHNKQEIKW
jgi:uracil-DNA glycosylase